MADLIEGGLDPAASAAVLLSATEWADPADERFAGATRWKMTEEMTIEADMPVGATHVGSSFSTAG